MDTASQPSAFQSSVFKILVGTSPQPFYVHTHVLARSEFLRKLVEGSWKESVEQTLCTNDYACSYPTPVLNLNEEQNNKKKDVEEGNSKGTKRALEHNEVVSAGGDDREVSEEDSGSKKQKMAATSVTLVPLRDLTWTGRNVPPPRLSQAEQFEKWSGHQLWSSDQLDYSAPLYTHAELYVMGCRYLLDDLRNMAWERLKAVLLTVGRPALDQP
ncbi:MAG: hypothetical protein Q9209_006466 [Squamulea sp. 1 TL-2023]